MFKGFLENLHNFRGKKGKKGALFAILCYISDLVNGHNDVKLKHCIYSMLHNNWTFG